jgi:glutamate-ammonia-ligase adenylyltransferase
MGRLGGRELSLGSDADVMFVFESPSPEADTRSREIALAVANEVRTLLAMPGLEPQLALDADLRPEGRQGALVRSLASYTAYYDRWSSPWEAQALLRARAVAGDPALGARFEEVADARRWPAGGLTPEALREMRRLKARMESERLPRGADPTLHTKLGRGGLADVEWTVQMLQMEHAHRLPDLRTTTTLRALDALALHGVVPESDASALRAAWLLASRLRDAITIARGTPSDMIPSGGRDLASVAHVLGYAPGMSGALLEDYRRVTRRARSVVERVFYGEVAAD